MAGQPKTTDAQQSVAASQPTKNTNYYKNASEPTKSKTASTLAELLYHQIKGAQNYFTDWSLKSALS